MLTPKEAKELLVEIEENPSIFSDDKEWIEKILKKYTEYDLCTTCTSYTSCKDENKGTRCEYYMNRYGE